jgi:pantoate--beta-alanine ligase
MQIIRTIQEMQQAVRHARKEFSGGGTVGLVPTMGALHEGHLSLVRRARTENAFVSATIFVNPLQFAPNEDLDEYPRTFEADCDQLEREGVDVLFAPAPDEMYPRLNGTKPATIVDPGPLGDRLDGVSRPRHFVGVATVVAKLFNIAMPDRAYFGQKDAAQLAVLRQMVRDLNFPLEIIACPIVRDFDGLALSSRNRYLSAADRRDALLLNRTLGEIYDRIAEGARDSASLCADPKTLREAGPNFKLEYLWIVDPDTLLPVPEAIPGSLIAIAAKVGTTRLIDNMLAV